MVIANDHGHRITPTWVSFTNEERLIGDAAKNASHSNPENTVADAKRLIGRKFDDPELKCDTKHCPFKIAEKGGKLGFQVKYKSELREFVRVPPLCADESLTTVDRLSKRSPL